MKNVTGKTALLRALKVGESAVWVPEAGRLPSREMALFQAVMLKLQMRVTQKIALLVMEDEIPVQVVIVKREA